MNFRLSKNQPNKARQEIKSKNFASKLFIVVEGKETEIVYFNAFISYYADNLLKEFILLDKIDGTLSNQFSIVKQIDSLLKTSKDLDAKAIAKFNDCKNDLLSREIEDVEILNEILQSLKVVINDDEKYKEIFGKLNNSESTLIEVLEIIETFHNFEKDIDKVLIVIDRDFHSFTSSQFDKVINICEDNNYLLGLTNPCFEFFLYLHFSNTENMNEESLEKLSKNVKISPKSKINYSTRILKDELKKHKKSYKKSKFDADFIVKNFQFVESNIKKSKLNIDAKSLKTELGTTLNKILKSFI